MTVLTFKGNSTLYLNSVIRTINGIFIRFSAVQVGYIWYSFSNLVEVLRNHLTIHSLLHAFVCFRTFIFLNYFIKLLHKSMWQQDKSKMFITQICTHGKKHKLFFLANLKKKYLTLNQDSVTVVGFILYLFLLLYILWVLCIIYMIF